MPIPAGVGRISLRGTLRGGEVWETGWWGQGSNFATSDGCNTIAASAVTTLGVSSIFNALTQMWDSATSLNGVVVYGYPDGGPNAGAIGEAPVTGYVGSGSGELPLQCALVATTLTGKPGRSYRGRMYWPATGCPLTAGQVSASMIGNLATAVAQLVAADASSSLGPIVLSQKHGTYETMTAIRVDSKIDIQRRRAARESIANVATHETGV